ncbi:hypothetical protein N9U39_01770 [Candidatus Pelagibacter sp.]|nr:hypothetical protein [Candidatus Pelagibacter sp.]|tara:strand:+ start:225 stop:812 length:588 start_codon:yes stop_codon:yes gene_type:complete
MKNLRNLLFSLICLLTSIVNANSENVRIGFEGGILWADIRAEETAQALANLSGSTVTYTYDEATWVGRVFADYELSTETALEVGFFVTGSLDATYTISGASATEGYDATGVDVAAVFKSDGLYFKAGMHRSELNGAASLNIGGTTYNISETISGNGFLVGGGIEIDDSRIGYTYYSDVGGDSDSDMSMITYGIFF